MPRATQDADLVLELDRLVTKLRWAKTAGRRKDLEDARNVVAVQGGALDWPYLSRWCGELDVLDLLATIRQ